MTAGVIGSRRPGVLFIVNSLEFGGAEKQVVTVLNHLDPRRYRLHLAYLKRNEKLLPELRQERLASLVCCDVARRVDVGASRQLSELIETADVDVIVCTNPYSTLYGHLARRGSTARPKLAAVFHTTLLRSIKERLEMLLYRRLFNRCDVLVYVCENQRRYWRSMGVCPPADDVIYNGIDTDYYTDRRSDDERLAFRRSLGLTAEDYVIGLCSVFRPEKAHVDLLDALGKLRSRGVPAKALLIGDGPERATIASAATRLGVEQHVLITGFREDVRPFIGACDVMTLVSHSVESFSLAALESMSLGKPMVMSDIGGAGELIIHGEHGFLFPPGDTQALALHLGSLARRPLREQLGRAAAARVRERFTVGAMSERFADCIDRLLEEQAQPLAANNEHARTHRIA